MYACVCHPRLLLNLCVNLCGACRVERASAVIRRFVLMMNMIQRVSGACRIERASAVGVP